MIDGSLINATKSHDAATHRPRLCGRFDSGLLCWEYALHLGLLYIATFTGGKGLVGNSYFASTPLRLNTSHLANVGHDNGHAEVHTNDTVETLCSRDVE